MLALYIVGGLVALGVLVLSIPVDMALELELHDEMRTKVRVGWLFGLVWKEVRARKKRPAEEKKKAKRDIGPFIAFIRTRGMLRRLLKLVRQVLRRLHVRQLDSDVRLGLDDPGDTGIVYAFSWPALAYLNSLRPVSVRFEPCFAEPLLEFRMHGTMRVYPAQMAGPLLSFAVSPAFLRAIRSVAAWRWRRRR